MIAVAVLAASLSLASPPPPDPKATLCFWSGYEAGRADAIRSIARRINAEVPPRSAKAAADLAYLMSTCGATVESVDVRRVEGGAK